MRLWIKKFVIILYICFIILFINIVSVKVVLYLEKGWLLIKIYIIFYFVIKFVIILIIYLNGIEIKVLLGRF